MIIVKSTETMNSTTWRCVVKLLYEACGSPDVTGYPDHQVRYILAGERPIESSFSNALVSACQSRVQTAPVSPWRLPLDMNRVQIPSGPGRHKRSTQPRVESSETVAAVLAQSPRPEPVQSSAPPQSGRSGWLRKFRKAD